MKKYLALFLSICVFTIVTTAIFVPHASAQTRSCTPADTIAVPPSSAGYADAYRDGHFTGCNRQVQGLNDGGTFCYQGSNVPDNYTTGAVTTNGGYTPATLSWFAGCRDGYVEGTALLNGQTFNNAGGGPAATQTFNNAGNGPAASNGPAAGVLNTEESVIALINKIINWMFTIFISAAVIMFIYAAFIYLTAGGGENVGTAHKMIMYGAIAVAVATLSRGLVSLVQNFVSKP